MIKKEPTSSGIPITFSKVEYRILLQVVYQQLFMLESIVDQQNTKEFERLSSLSSKLIKYAPEFASADLIAKDVTDGSIYPNTAFLDAIMQTIAEYDEVSFWEELTHRMAERDLLRQYQGLEISKLTEVEYLEKLSERLAFYTNRLGEEGIDNMELTD